MADKNEKGVKQKIPLNLNGIEPHFMNDNKSSIRVPQRNTTREPSFSSRSRMEECQDEDDEVNLLSNIHSVK